MDSQFNPLTVTTLKKETPDATVVEFEVPSDLKPRYKFKAGQYLVLKTNIDGKEERRNYSICASPTEDKLRVLCKKVPDGIFSTFVNDRLKVGEKLDVMVPGGKFFADLNPKQHRRYFALAAGSGITPIIAIIKAALEIEPNSTFTLLYVNRTRKDIIFLEELESIKNRYLGRFRVFHSLTRERQDVELLYGRMDLARSKRVLQAFVSDLKGIDTVFLCGPWELMDTSQQALLELGVKEDQIRREPFFIDGKQTRRTVDTESQTDSKRDIRIKIQMDGITHEILARAGESIIDAALASGLELPYSCQGGMCATCKAQITKGNAPMDINYALTDEEVQNGFTLTCQAIPQGPVEVNFDAR